MSDSNANRTPIAEYQTWDIPHFPEVESSRYQAWKTTEDPVDSVALPTATELEAIRQEAYQAGFKQGQQEGIASGNNQVAEAVAQLLQVANALYQPLQQQQDQLEQALLELMVILSRQVIKRELSLDTSQILSVVKEAIKLLPLNAEAVALYVSPKDFELIMEHREAMSEHQKAWKIEANASIAAGGCVVETPETLIDATVDLRSREIVNQLYADALQAEQQALDESSHPLSQTSEFIAEEAAMIEYQAPDVSLPAKPE